MNKTFAALAVSAFALMGCDSGTANAQNPSAMPAMSAEMQQQHDNMQKERTTRKKLWMNTAGLWTTIKK